MRCRSSFRKAGAFAQKLGSEVPRESVCLVHGNLEEFGALMRHGCHGRPSFVFLGIITIEVYRVLSHL